MTKPAPAGVVSPAKVHASTPEAVLSLPVRFLGDLESPVRVFAFGDYLPCVVAFGSPASTFGVVDPVETVTFNVQETQALAIHANRRREPKRELWRWAQLKHVHADTVVRHSCTANQAGQHDCKRTWYGDGKDRISLSDRWTMSALLAYFELIVLHVHIGSSVASRDTARPSGGDNTKSEHGGAQARERAR